jgi:uncharacterized membrane protein
MINVVNKYLDRNGYSNQKESFEDLFLSHPNYPSVFAITDSLDMLSIDNVAIKVPKEQFIDLPDSFLAIFNQNMVLVSKSKNNIEIENEDASTKNITSNEFLTHWNEVIIAVEQNVNLALKSKNNSKWLSYTLPFIVLIALSIFFNKYNLNSFLTLITSLIGMLFSILIIQEKFGIKSEMASKFCNINPNASCDTVIKSNQGEINKWFSFSDLPLLFFSISVLSIIIQPKESSFIVDFLSLLSFPIIAYSIILQKFKLKKWCVLCLLVSFIIVTQSLVFGFTTTSFNNITSTYFSAFLLSVVLATFFWMQFKPVFEEKIKQEKEINKLKKFKRNYGVFKFLSKSINNNSELNNLKGIFLGKTDADLQLTLILSPSCGHCHKAFEDGLNLINQFSDKVALTILFNINPDNNDNRYKIVVEKLLSINNSNPDRIEEAISDWHIKQIGLEKWQAKWQVDTIDMRINHQIHLQYNWCLENDFNYTPVKIVNKKLLPNDYEIAELKYFMNNFSEEEIIDNEVLNQA